MPTSLDTYLERIRSTFPHLRIETAVLNSEGLINDVVIVNETLVCRFGKHEWAARDLDHEEASLTLVGRHVDLPVPLWTRHAPDFVSYPLIQGMPLLQHRLRAADQATREAVARQLGTFLQQLHDIPLEEAAAHDIGASVTNRTREEYLSFYHDLQDEVFGYLMPAARLWVHDLFAPLQASATFLEAEPAFVNGDISMAHVIADPDTLRANGIIDFGTAGIGDPAVDLACVIEQYGEGFLRLIDPHYPDIAAHIERARFLAGTLQLQWLVGGFHDPDDPSWFAVHIGHAFDAGAIGSGW